MAALLEITVDEAYRPVCLIPDANGEFQSYTFLVTGRTPWTCIVTRQDSGDVHTVTEGNGRWHCTCEDFRYRGRKRNGCKHSFACKGLRSFLRSLIPDVPNSRAV